MSIKVYVAGAIGGGDPTVTFNNIRRGIDLSVQVLKLPGFVPFSPFIDFSFFLQQEISLEEIQKYSMEWLEECDCVLVNPVNAESSKGTQKEIRRAEELGMPVFYDIQQLKDGDYGNPNMTLAEVYNRIDRRQNEYKKPTI